MEAVRARSHNKTLVLVVGPGVGRSAHGLGLFGLRFTPGSWGGRIFVTMSDHTIDTKFGRAQVRVHRTAVGWRAMLVGQHLIPYPPSLQGPPAHTEAEAVAQLEAAVRVVAHVA